MESYNALLIKQGMDQKTRMLSLRDLAVSQLQTLEAIDVSAIKKLGE